MPTLEADVIVVGAGPAGSAAAITLARLQRRVIVVDKAVFPRDKCCGDGLTTAALRRFESLGLDPGTVASWEPVHEAVVVATDGYEVGLPMPPGGALFAASAKRSDLDAALLGLARSAGAGVIEGNAVVDVRCGDRCATTAAPVSVDLDDGRTLRAHYAIAADGAWSTVRKALGLGEAGYLGDWQAGRQYFANVGPNARRLWVWFEPDMIPGYAWSFPLPGGAANVGYGVIRRPGHPLGPLKGQRIDFLARRHIAAVLGPSATPAGAWKAWPIPAHISDPDLALSGVGGRVLFTGDAARACDPMTGEGIAQAVETAELAARAVDAAGPHHPGRAATRYRRQVRWGLALDDRLARLLSQVLARPSGSARALSIVDVSAWTRRGFVRWMFEDYPRAALATPHRWRPDLLTRPGAYSASRAAAPRSGLARAGADRVRSPVQ